MAAIRKPVLFIGGLDPSAGAGILADVKTSEQLFAYGLGVSTALTFQTDQKFVGLTWHSEQEVFSQMDPLFERFSIEVVKIGFVRSIEALASLADYIRAYKPRVKIIWDPILSTSTGFELHSGWRMSQLVDVLNKLYLVTPNLAEAMALCPGNSAMESAEALSKYCNVYLKGGHALNDTCEDHLFYNGKHSLYKSKKIEGGEKHGSGCVFAAALSSLLTRCELEEAAQGAKDYVEKYLSSSSDLIGFHLNEAA